MTSNHTPKLCGEPLIRVARALFEEDASTHRFIKWTKKNNFKGSLKALQRDVYEHLRTNPPPPHVQRVIEAAIVASAERKESLLTDRTLVREDTISARVREADQAFYLASHNIGQFFEVPFTHQPRATLAQEEASTPGMCYSHKNPDTYCYKNGLYPRDGGGCTPYQKRLLCRLLNAERINMTRWSGLFEVKLACHPLCEQFVSGVSTHRFKAVMNGYKLKTIDNLSFKPLHHGCFGTNNCDPVLPDVLLIAARRAVAELQLPDEIRCTIESFFLPDAQTILKPVETRYQFVGDTKLFPKADPFFEQPCCSYYVPNNDTRLRGVMTYIYLVELFR